MKIGRLMVHRRLPLRDPRTVARDIPGVLDVLFPRLTGALVTSLNRQMFFFDGLQPLSDELVEGSQLQKAMLFQLSTARAEGILSGIDDPGWNQCLEVAVERQQRHYDARIPNRLEDHDKNLAFHAAENLVQMLRRIKDQKNDFEIEINPVIPGLGWIATGVGDFSIGPLLIEVKHTDRNFVANDFRQVLMYWLLRYSASLEKNEEVWSECILLNPRRNCALQFHFDHLLNSASASYNRVELFELLRSVVGQELERR